MTNLPTKPVFDVHVHVESGMDKYDLAASTKNVIFNHVQSYRDNWEKHRQKGDTVTLIVDTGSDFDYVRGEAEAGRINALKIHSRIQKLQQGDYDQVSERLSKLPAALPVIIDAFYYGKDLQFQPCLPAIIGLMSTFSDRRFVIAHTGGYRVLEYFFHLREFDNCFYDLSFALQYFEDCSLMQDLHKLIKYTPKTKLLFGSDHPFASAKRQYVNLLGICTDLGLAETEIDDILHNNARQLFGGQANA